MGEVYRARDTKPDRDVAIKVLPAALAKNSELSATQSKWPMHSKLRMKKESFIAP